MYYVLLAPELNRASVLEQLKASGVYSVFHYVPLHSSPAGQKFGKVNGSLSVTDRQSASLIRLPLWYGLTHKQQDKVVDVLHRLTS